MGYQPVEKCPPFDWCPPPPCPPPPPTPKQYATGKLYVETTGGNMTPITNRRFQCVICGLNWMGFGNSSAPLSPSPPNFACDPCYLTWVRPAIPLPPPMTVAAE